MSRIERVLKQLDDLRCFYLSLKKRNDRPAPEKTTTTNRPSK